MSEPLENIWGPEALGREVFKIFPLCLLQAEDRANKNMTTKGFCFYNRMRSACLTAENMVLKENQSCIKNTLVPGVVMHA
jgi:hypothetical protein